MWEAIKPLPPVRRTVGFEEGAVMITGLFAGKGRFGLAEISGNGLRNEGGHDAWMPKPLIWG